MRQLSAHGLPSFKDYEIRVPGHLSETFTMEQFAPVYAGYVADRISWMEFWCCGIQSGTLR